MAPLGDCQSKKTNHLGFGISFKSCILPSFLRRGHAFKSREHRKSLKRFLDPPLRPLVLLVTETHGPPEVLEFFC